MQKTLALFLVVSLVISVANLPTSHGISAGGSTWKRALEAIKEKRILCSALVQHCKHELKEDSEAHAPFKES